MNNQKYLTSIRGLKYEKISRLGEGQFGKVYKISDEKGTFFALKEIELPKLQLTESQKKSLLTETNIMDKINHPRVLHLEDKIVGVHGVGLVTTFCDGGDLENSLLKKSKNQGFGEEIGMLYLCEIAEAFYEFRKNKIIHRDLKLANIFLKNGHIVIGDFGFAKLGVSVTNSKLGTPYYMAPEILFSNQKSYDSRCDLWSIGVCFFLLIFGKLPFSGNSINDLISKIESQSGDKLVFPKHQQIRGQTKHILVRLLQKLPENRMTFSELFILCGINISQSEAQMFNSGQAIPESNTYHENLTASQILNFPGGTVLEDKNNSYHRPSHQNQNYKQEVYPKRYENQQEVHLANSFDPFATVHHKQSRPSLSLKTYNNLTPDPEFGFYFNNNQTDDIVTSPYLHEVNKLIFKLKTIDILESACTSNSNVFSNGEINVIFVLLQIFIARKIEIISSELFQVLMKKKNVFKINSFDFFIESELYSELSELFALFQKQTDYLFNSATVQFSKGNQNFVNDLKMYRDMQIGPIDSALKKLAMKLIDFYKDNKSSLSFNDKAFFLKIMLHLCYIIKVLNFPVNGPSSREWRGQYASIISSKDDKIEGFLMTLQTK